VNYVKPKLFAISGGIYSNFQIELFIPVRQFFKKTSVFQDPLISKIYFPSLLQADPII
jgi:hypothetical protein